jgi:hypothetical protein
MALATSPTSKQRARGRESPVQVASPVSYRKINPFDTLARLQSARCALDVCTAGVEASAGESIEKLDAERELLECLGSRRESFTPAEAWIERQRQDSVTLMTGRANAALHRQATHDMEVALTRSRHELRMAEETWVASLAR